MGTAELRRFLVEPMGFEPTTSSMPFRPAIRNKRAEPRTQQKGKVAVSAQIRAWLVNAREREIRAENGEESRGYDTNHVTNSCAALARAPNARAFLVQKSPDF